MATTRRTLSVWLAAAGFVILTALLLWLAQRQGWISSATAWIRPAAERDGAHEESMPGMGNQSEKGATPEPTVPGYAPVVVEPGLQQRIGVIIGTANREPLRMSVKTVGVVQPNEMKTARRQTS